jgi:uncharacterized protein (DUF433 family)
MGSDERIGVTRRTAAVVIGVTDRRLQRWNSRGLVNPSTITVFGTRSYWTYTLEDLVQGKVVRALEDAGIDVRIIRRVVESVRSSVHPNPLASLKWGTSGTEVFVGFPDGGWIGGRKPSQQVLVEVIDLNEIRLSARTSLQRPAEQVGQIEQRRSSLGHKPVFAGTRIAVSTVAAYLRRGIPVDEILEAFPDLTESDVALVGVELAKAS